MYVQDIWIIGSQLYNQKKKTLHSTHLVNYLAKFRSLIFPSPFYFVKNDNNRNKSD